jgi:hypothetical protein
LKETNKDTVFLFRIGLQGLEVKEKWRQWRYDNNQQVGGYVTTYSPGPFFFATVKGAGHMVPQMMPYPAYGLLFCFLDSEFCFEYLCRVQQDSSFLLFCQNCLNDLFFRNQFE